MLISTVFLETINMWLGLQEYKCVKENPSVALTNISKIKVINKGESCSKFSPLRYIYICQNHRNRQEQRIIKINAKFNLKINVKKKGIKSLL